MIKCNESKMCFVAKSLRSIVKIWNEGSWLDESLQRAEAFIHRRKTPGYRSGKRGAEKENMK